MSEKTEQKEKREKGSDELHFDYKNVAQLSEYINAHARILGRRRSKLSAHEQRELAGAVKRARFMALMPYISR